MITSTSNPKVKFIRSLRQRKCRWREGRFFVEGVRAVGEAVEAGAPVEMLVYSPELLVSEVGQKIVGQVPSALHLIVSERVFRSLSERDQPQGIGAVIRIQEKKLSEIDMGEEGFVVVAWQLQDPGNVGCIIRTSDATGASGVVVVQPSADPYDPQAVRASMGSLFALPVVRAEEKEVMQWWDELQRERGMRVVATSARTEKEIYEANLRGPLAVVLGNEQKGLPQRVRERADLCVRLPMSGRATSLNVAAAAAAVLYEVVRQRQQNGER